MEGGTTLPELRRAIGADGRTLLRKYNLLKPLVEQMITSEAIAGVEVSAEALEKAKLELLDQRGFETMEQWSEMLADLGRTDEEVIDRLERVIRRQEYIRERFAPKAEARFLERKNELDQVVYSLLRLANNFLARELYLQIESGESNFALRRRARAQHQRHRRSGVDDPGPSRSGRKAAGGPTWRPAGAVPDR